MNSSSPARPEPFSITRLRDTLNRTFRVCISDGRIFVGTFVCTDKEKNIILTNTDEFRVGQADVSEGRYVGMVMIPWRHIVKVEAEHDDDELYH